MNKTRKIIIITTLFIAVLIIGFVATFFATAFEKVNNTIVFANKSSISEIKNAELSESVLRARVVSDFISTDENYVNLKTKYDMPTIKNGQMSFVCNIKAVVKGWDGDFEETFEGTREFILVFEKMHWRVKSIK